MASCATLQVLPRKTHKASQEMAFTTRSILPTHTDKTDFNGDGLTDLVWSGANGDLVIWNMDASGIYGVGSGYIPNPGNGLVLKGSGDLNSNGTADLIWQDAAGHIEVWAMKDNQAVAKTALATAPQVQAIGDFNGDGKADVLWHSDGGGWFSASTEAGRKIPPLGLGQLSPIDPDYQLVGTGDFNADGRDDMLFRGTGAHLGSMVLHEPVQFTPGASGMPTQVIDVPDPGTDWSVLGLADFNGDKQTDILWQHTNAAGQVDARAMWIMDGGSITSSAFLWNPGADWRVIGTSDYDNNGKTDILWRHEQLGWNVEVLMDGSNVAGFGSAVVMPSDFWTLGSV
jgi:hypothetical protein